MARRINTIEKHQQHHIDVGGLRIAFQRTCRVPEGKLNGLPAGLGAFPIYKVRDFRAGTPREWRDDGHFMPMYPQEAMWMSFSGGYARGNSNGPQALVVGAGNINAISGKPFNPAKDRLRGRIGAAVGGIDVELDAQQNYVVVPPQPWLDGWKAPDGKVYQFVAAELGSGQTVEGQITGEETVGGIQLIGYRAAKELPLIHSPRFHGFNGLECAPMLACCADVGGSPGRKSLRSSATSMGLGRGGEIEQKIYPDPYGVDVWEENPSAVEVVYLLSSADFQQVTGYHPPSTPVTYERYQQQGLPWFHLWDKHYGDTKGSDVFGDLKPVDGGMADGGLLDKLKPKA